LLMIISINNNKINELKRKIDTIQNVKNRIFQKY
jgi:hypothetical protein